MALFAMARQRLMHFYFRLARPMTLGVRVAALDEGRVFLVRHTYVAGWHLPGGGVDVGETLEEAARREIREEANLELLGPLELHGVFLNARISRRDHVGVFVARRVQALGPAPRNREIAEGGFFALDALPDDTTRATRARLAEIFAGAPRDPWW